MDDASQESGRHLEAAVGRRVYTYVDDEGNTYWSFYRAPTVIGPPTRLTLQGRVGQHLINFLTKLRRHADVLDKMSGGGG